MKAQMVGRLSSPFLSNQLFKKNPHLATFSTHHAVLKPVIIMFKEGEKQTGIILIMNKSITCYVPGTVLSVSDKQLGGEGWEAGGRTNKDAAPWGSHSLVRDRLLLKYYGTGPPVVWVLSRHTCQEHQDTREEYRDGICCVVLVGNPGFGLGRNMKTQPCCFVWDGGARAGKSEKAPHQEALTVQAR